MVKKVVLTDGKIVKSNFQGREYGEENYLIASFCENAIATFSKSKNDEWYMSDCFEMPF